MTITELVSYLQAMKVQHGDIEVGFKTTDIGNKYERKRKELTKELLKVCNRIPLGGDLTTVLIIGE